MHGPHIFSRKLFYSDFFFDSYKQPHFIGPLPVCICNILLVLLALQSWAPTTQPSLWTCWGIFSWPPISWWPSQCISSSPCCHASRQSLCTSSEFSIACIPLSTTTKSSTIATHSRTVKCCQCHLSHCKSTRYISFMGQLLI